MSKKVSIIIILLVMTAACISIWPLRLIRKDTVCWTQSAQYVDTVLESDTNAVLEQTFTAREAYLKEIAFAVAFAGDECSIDFGLYRDGRKLFGKQMEIGEEYNSRFYYVAVNQWVEKGELYTFRVEVLNTEDVHPQFRYTTDNEGTAEGNVLMKVNGELYDAQAVTSYTYMEPLNYKNTVCIWAVILTMGFSVLGMTVQKKYKFDLWLDRILNKYQFIFLALEIIFVTVLVLRVCLTETVDWDEAYTWKIVTQNSLVGVIKAQAVDNHPPLYFLIAKMATLIFGNKMIVFKAVSVAGAFASMLLCITLVRKRWGVKAAVPLILVLGLGPQFLYYNINLRMYSWMVFFVFAAGLCAYELVCRDRNFWWVLLCLATLGALYTQYFAVIPLLVIYTYLLIICVRNKRVKRFILCCAATVAAYLPQLYLVWRMLSRDSAAQNDEMPASLNLVSLCTWSFQNNIKWSEYMPLALYVLAVVLLTVWWKKLEREKAGFLVLAAAVFPVTAVISYFVSENMNHFWHNRYMLDALIFLWIFIILIYAGHNNRVWSCFCVWLGITVLSSYTVVCAEEFGMMSNTADAKDKLSCVQNEKIVVYNFPTYDVLYEYYVPGAEFVWIEDVNFADMEQEYVYMISWGGLGFEPETVERYDIHIEYLQSFTLEKGVGGVYLCRVTFQK